MPRQVQELIKILSRLELVEKDRLDLQYHIEYSGINKNKVIGIINDAANSFIEKDFSNDFSNDFSTEFLMEI